MTTVSRIIDTHQHVGWNAGRDGPSVVADMDAQRIEYAWLLGWEIAPSEDRPDCHAVLSPMNLRGDGTHAGIPLRDLIAARDRYPRRFVLGYCPHPLVGDAPALLRAAVAIHGVKVCGEWKCRLLLDDPRCLELFHTAGELRLPVVLHLDAAYRADGKGRRTYRSGWYGGSIESLERALQACPETVFVGHGPGFWREIGADADTDPAQYPRGPVSAPGKLQGLLTRNPNLYADLSAGSGLMVLQRDPSHAAKFLSQHHERLLFARDCQGPALHDFPATLPLPAEIMANIFHRNAERLVAKPS